MTPAPAFWTPDALRELAFRVVAGDGRALEAALGLESIELATFMENVERLGYEMGRDAADARQAPRVLS